MKKLSRWILGEHTFGPKQQEVMEGYQNQRPSFGETLLTLGGMGAGAYLGGPMGAMMGGQAGSTVGKAVK